MNLLEAWPLFALKIETPDLVLKLATPEQIVQQSALIREAGGLLEESQMNWLASDFHVQPAPQLERSSLQHFWSNMANWSVENWNLGLRVFQKDNPEVAVGITSLYGVNFVELRQVKTGSWLLPQFRQRGYGLQMRAACLGFGFEYLGAKIAFTTAHADNSASNRVSQKMGYKQTGHEYKKGGAQKVELYNNYELFAKDFKPPFELKVHGFDKTVFGL